MVASSATRHSWSPCQNYVPLMSRSFLNCAITTQPSPPRPLRLSIHSHNQV
ncbi:unnamed protein product [Brassica oleracea var. botrytis]|uniref:Uncharacterized protein n=2 Tax=Brassica TaxID=3705 RepID=A0A3P6B3B9_BRAOL|nr:unnamed protein product [Brassica napus]CDY08715.1 BnaC03g54670D [Brassica napus]VDC96665.1 unnamed protein product [Brassica oleracea]